MTTKTYRINSIIVPSGRFVPHLEPVVDGDPDASVLPIILYDGDDSEDGCRMTVDDKPVDRWELLRWFAGAKGVTVEIDSDERRYGHVIEARFSAAS